MSAEITSSIFQPSASSTSAKTSVFGAIEVIERDFYRGGVAGDLRRADLEIGQLIILPVDIGIEIEPPDLAIGLAGIPVEQAR